VAVRSDTAPAPCSQLRAGGGVGAQQHAGGVDAPDPTDARHQHLYGHHDTTRALLEVRRPNNAAPLMAACVLCGQTIDLAASLRGTRAAERSLAREAEGREAARTPVAPGPPAWAADVPVEP
jgi:hypothetical protein